MRFYSHADDFGLSEGITDGILRCLLDGALNSTSVMVNGWATEYAAKVWHSKARPDWRLCLHFNLAEGPCVADPELLPDLVDARGEFRQSFFGLMMRFLTGGDKRRRSLSKQVGLELRAQVEQFRELFGAERPLFLDSHRHYHLLPFVLQEIVGLKDDCQIAGVRIVREPSIWAWPPSPWLGSGIIKHVLLNGLSRRGMSVLRQASIPFNEAFVGVLFTGRMTPGVVRRALQALNPEQADGWLEVLFHPGRATEDERQHWRHRPELATYYLSEARDREARSLLDPEYRAVLAEHSISLNS